MDRGVLKILIYKGLKRLDEVGKARRFKVTNPKLPNFGLLMLGGGLNSRFKQRGSLASLGITFNFLTFWKEGFTRFDDVLDPIWEKERPFLEK